MNFYGYTVRATADGDLPLAVAWTDRALDAGFWFDRKDEPRRHNFLVLLGSEPWKGAWCKCGHHFIHHHLTSQDEEGEMWCMECKCKDWQEGPPPPGPEPIALFQVEYRWSTQVRLHFQASPVASPKKILRGITMLVPLIEKGLASGGVRHIFFTSHSLAMIAFMEKRMGYRLAQNTDGGVDGAVMFKEISGQPPVASAKVEFHVTAVPATLPPHCGSVLRVVADAPSSAGAAPQEPNRPVQGQTAERGSK